LASRKKTVTDPQISVPAPPPCKLPGFLFRVGISILGAFVFAMTAVGYTNTLRWLFNIQDINTAVGLALVSASGAILAFGFLVACWSWNET
jgi:hypothetical protein